MPRLIHPARSSYNKQTIGVEPLVCLARTGSADLPADHRPQSQMLQLAELISTAL